MRIIPLVLFVIAGAVIYGINLAEYSYISSSVNWQGQDWELSTANFWMTAFKHIVGIFDSSNNSSSLAEKSKFVVWISSVLFGTGACFLHLYGPSRPRTDFSRKAWTSFLLIGLLTALTLPMLVYCARLMLPNKKLVWGLLLFGIVIETFVVEPVLSALVMIISLVVFFAFFPLGRR